MKIASKGMKWALVFVAGSVVGFVLPNISWKSGPARDLPIVFQEIRTMGELRTARVDASKVVAVQSSLQAPTVLSWVIGVPEALKAVSTSEAGVQVTGRLEAGVDLAQAEFQSSRNRVTVHLPRAVISAGPSHTELLWTNESWLNRDRKLALRAQDEAKKALVQTAGTAQLVLTAERQAEALIKSILSQAGAEQVTIVWKGHSQST